MSSDNSAADPVGLLAEEFVRRYRRGERPSLSEYTQRYPEYAVRIGQVFPLMALMEEAGSSVDSCQNQTDEAARNDRWHFHTELPGTDAWAMNERLIGSPGVYPRWRRVPNEMHRNLE